MRTLSQFIRDFSSRRLTFHLSPFKSKRIDDQIVRISNKQISLSLKNNGKFVEVHHLEHDEKISFDVTPIHYGTSRDSDRNSGAYLFIPDGEAREIPMGVNDIVRIQRGPLSSRVEILHEMFALQLQLSETMSKTTITEKIFKFCLSRIETRKKRQMNFFILQIWLRSQKIRLA